MTMRFRLFEYNNIGNRYYISSNVIIRRYNIMRHCGRFFYTSYNVPGLGEIIYYLDSRLVKKVVKKTNIGNFYERRKRMLYCNSCSVNNMSSMYTR